MGYRQSQLTTRRLRCQRKRNLNPLNLIDDIKVFASATVGIGNWWVDIDLVLKCCVSLATLVYIVIKIRQLCNTEN